jgi:hypothetical protein
MDLTQIFQPLAASLTLIRKTKSALKSHPPNNSPLYSPFYTSLQKCQSFVNRCLRYIMKIWWPRVISNEMLWEMTGQRNINKEIRQRKFGWIGHTLRKDDSEPCKAALQWNPQGTRGRGRPRNSWRRTTLNECGKHS